MAVALSAVGLQTDVHAELGQANSTAACCQLTTSLAHADLLRGEDGDPDNQFFTGEAAPPNIHFLVDNSCSMQELVQATGLSASTFWADDPAGDGCSNSRLLLHQAAKGWDAATTYPFPDQGVPGLAAFPPNENLFIHDQVYGYNTWRDYNGSGSQTIANVASGTDADCKVKVPDWNTTDVGRRQYASCKACKGRWPNWNIAAYDALQFAQCRTCMDTKGFYRKPGTSSSSGSSNFMFMGNYLNFNPPKYVVARAVMKEVVASMIRVRMGLTIFDNSNTGGVLQVSQNPPCNLSLSEGSHYENNRNSILNKIDSMRFDSNTPLAESLLNIGQHFSSSDDIYTTKFGFSSGYLKNSFKNGSLSGQNRSVCWGCQVSSVIVITDGQPTQDSSLPRTQIETLNGGPVICPDNECNFLECPGGNCSASGRNDMLDDVAKLLYEQDLQENSPAVVGAFNTAGQQSVVTYGIGLGIEAPLLENATRVGGGAYFEADDASTLKQRILDVVALVQQRATSFSAASASSFQVNRAGGAILPRFVPNPNVNKPWTGTLYRFNLAAERITQYGGSNCDPAQAATLLSGGAGDPNDLNRNGSCDDVNLVDAEDDAVIEDDDGRFRKMKSPLVDAVPFWEAGKVLKSSAADLTTRWQTRKIWTAIDNGPGGGDGKLDYHDTPVEFTVANAGLLREYLGIRASGVTPECQALADAMGEAPFTPLECAEWIVRYVRGADILNPDPAKRLYDRGKLLADIFHSSPIVVDPPSSKDFCGFGNQCLESLWSTATPLRADYVADGATRDAYDEFEATYFNRDKVVLVGSNDGLWHAFHSGTFEEIDEYTGQGVYDEGTGEELWAFVPPDLLPRLSRSIDKHVLLADGTAMVREVWIDGVDGTVPDQVKQATEYRTLAIIGNGAGGVHRFALDVTNPATPPSATGAFRWMWPQPCDPLALVVGDSSGNFSPRPPPVGPVAIANPTGPLEVDGVKAEERWVAFFNGGFAPQLNRGRGVAMVDVRDGTTLWSQFYGDSTPNASSLTVPFLAPVAMMDLGKHDGVEISSDGLFDTATVGDYGGAVWTIRFWKPGTIVSGKVNNWFMAKSFQVETNPTTGMPPAFSHMTSNTIQPATGYLRTYIGTGDRVNLLDHNGPVCRLSNPYGCARLGCVVKNGSVITRDSVVNATHIVSYLNNTTGPATLLTTSSVYGSGGDSCQSATMKLSWSISDSNQGAAGTPRCDLVSNGSVEYHCTGDTSTFACNAVTNDWLTLETEAPTPPTWERQRFYGFWSYGVSEDRRFDSSAEALAFGTRYPTASPSRPMSDPDLVDVSATTADTSGVVSGSVASETGNGWYLQYTGEYDTGSTVELRPYAEKTGTAATIIDGCVVWNSFQPIPNGSSLCSTAGENLARLYQANFITGAPNCARSFIGSSSWARTITRNVVAVPGEPIAAWIVGSGQGMTSVVTLEAGATTGSAVTTGTDLLQSVYQVEVDRTQHNCRHDGVAAQCK